MRRAILLSVIASIALTGRALALPLIQTPAPTASSLGAVQSNGGDVSSTNVHVAGGVPRLVSAHNADLTDVLDILPQASAATDYTAVINAALASGKMLWFPYTGIPYRYTPPAVFGPNSGLIGQPGVVLAAYGTVAQQIIKIPATAINATIRDIMFDGTNAVQYPSYCNAPGFSFTGGGMTHVGSLLLSTGCDGATVQGGVYSWGSSAAIQIVGGNYDAVLNNDIELPENIGITANNGSGYFRVVGNYTKTGTFAEFFAAFVGSHDGEVSDNRSVNAGDNAYSLSGNNIRFERNRASGALGHGLANYGDRNTDNGNIFTDSGQFYNPNAVTLTFQDGTTKAFYNAAGYGGPFYCMDFVGAFGGYAQGNMADGNTCDDDQTTPTQDGINIQAGQALWASGTYAVNSYVYTNGSTYKVTTAGTSTVAPSGTTTFADPTGTAVWTWISTPRLATREPSGNVIGPNQILRWKTYDYRDQTSNHGNTYHGRNFDALSPPIGQTTTEPSVNTVTGGWHRTNPMVAIGNAVTAGQVYSSNGPGTTYVYQDVLPCTVSVLPAGITLAAAFTDSDGCKWLTLGNAYGSGMQLEPLPYGGVGVTGPLTMHAIGSTTVLTQMYAGAGSPLSVVAAPQGSLYVRTDGGASTTLYVKESGADASGWVAK